MSESMTVAFDELGPTDQVFIRAELTGDFEATLPKTWYSPEEPARFAASHAHVIEFSNAKRIIRRRGERIQHQHWDDGGQIELLEPTDDRYARFDKFLTRPGKAMVEDDMLLNPEALGRCYEEQHGRA